MAGKSSPQSLSAPVVKSVDESCYAADKEKDDFGIGLEKLCLGPRKKLLVLDLNGFLLSKIYCGKSNEISNVPNHGRRFGSFLIFKRPFCEEFLKFCFERFEVGIWSSALRHNVEGALTYLMGSMERKLLFVWDQSNCTDSGFKRPSHDGNGKPLFLKELKMIWNKEKLGPYTQKNTLLVDNDPHKALLNPPYTGIFPVAYNAALDRADNFLDPKGEFGKFLRGLAEADEVPSYVKQNPFGQPAISTNHPDWDFYSAVLNRFNGK